MLNFDQEQILRRLLHHKAVISIANGCDAFPAHPLGDRRKRPAFWVRSEDLHLLKAAGALELDHAGYRVAETVERRLKHGKDGQARNQHYDLEERDVYVQGGVKRKASVNRRLSALDRLSHQTDLNGAPLLEAALIEAGKRIARDYHASGHGLAATQSYDGAGVQTDNGARAQAVEDSYIRAADAKARLRTAREAMGDGLDSAVIAVCCLDQSLDIVERAEHWAKGSGLTVLRLGLTRLSIHYGTVAGVKPKPAYTNPRVQRRTGTGR